MYCKIKEALRPSKRYLKQPIIFGLILSVILTILILRKFLVPTKGIAITGDLIWAYDEKLYPRYVWYPFTQRSIPPGLIIWTNIILEWFPSELAERVFISLIFVLMGLSMFYVSFKVLEELKISVIGSVIATITYVISPIVITRLPHIHFLTGYALVPFIFYLVFNYFKRGEDRRNPLFYSVLTAITWSVMSLVSPHWIFFGLLLIILFTLLAIHKPYRAYLINAFLYFTFTIFFYTLFNLWQLLPALMASIRGLTYVPSYIVSIEVLEMLSRHATIIHVFMQQANWWPVSWPGEIYSNASIPYPLWILSNFVVPIVAFAAILTPLFRDRRVIALIILTILSISLATGVKYPILGDVYEYLVFKAPVISNFGWIFRDPDKWSALIGLAYSLLCAITFGYLGHKIKRYFCSHKIKQYLCIGMLTLLILVFTTIAAFPLLTGNLSGKLDPQELPYEYMELNKWLESQNEYFKVLIYPSPPRWGVPKPTVPQNEYWQFITKSLFNNRSTNIGKLLSIWNVKYVIVKGDSLQNREKSYILSRLLLQKDLKLVKTFGSLYVFENEDYISSNVYIPVQNIIITELSNLVSLSSENFYNPINSSLLILDQSISKINYKCILKSHIFIVKRDTQDVLLSFLLVDYFVIKPFDATNHHNPAKMWSKAATNDPLHGSFHPYLEKFGMENWQFDYKEGLVFTWATLLIPENVKTRESDIIRKWEFSTESEFNEWEKYIPENQFSAVCKVLWDEKEKALRIELYNSTWGWKTINSPLIPANVSKAYAFTFRIKGENAHEVHVKVVEYDSDGKYLGSKYVENVESGNFDWKTVTFNYVPENEETKYIQLQIWHGHQTDKPLPNIIWIDDVKVYDITKYTKPVALEIPFKVNRTDNYKLFIRYFENQEGGVIRVHLDSKPVEIRTKDDINKFVWKEVGTFYLDKGRHEIVLENVKGFNAVNLFVLIPEGEYYKAKEEVKKTLQNKTIIYLFEAESDLYRENANIVKDFNASNGEALAFTPGSNVWQNIDISEDNLYRVALRLKGSFMVLIDNQMFKVNSTTLSLVELDPVYLNEGEHRIEIKPLIREYVAWNFSSESDLEEWREYTPENQFGSTYKLLLDSETLRVELWNSTWGWKTINSPLVPASYGRRYTWEFRIKGENAHAVHVKVFEYNINKSLIGGYHIAGIGDGTFDWKNIQIGYEPKNEETKYIQLQIWHGHQTDKPLPNIIWIDDVKVYREYEPSYLDVIWIHSIRKENETLQDVFSVTDIPAEVIEYRKVNPVKWIVRVKAKKPFMLAFTEAYDPLWTAKISDIEYKSMPLYRIINGFWINKTGYLTIYIVYKPQEWFEFGLKISTTTFVFCSFYLVYDWRKDWWQRIFKRITRFLRMVR